MKKFFFIFTLIITFLLLASAVYYFQTFSSRKINIFSPLPSFLDFTNNAQVSTLDVWYPDIKNVVKSSVAQPDVSARSALVYDITSGKTLYSKNSFEELPMASLTKIMTAALSLENPKANDQYQVSKADLVGEDSMGLTAGEILPFNDLLYGLMLNSGNDAAEVLASNSRQGRDKFILAMNNKAKSLGLLDTHFTNPTGLEGDGNQFTTAYDLLVITNYALKYPLFRKVVFTFDHNIDATSTHKAFFLENETNLLTSYPGVMGVKTGYTPEAGLCLVTYLNYKEHEIIGILLGSDNRRQEMKDLLDYSLKSEGITPPVHQ